VTGEAGGPHPVTAVELKAQIEAERTGRPFLAYRDSEGERHLLSIESGVTELWVGRSPSSDVRLSWDEEVSALHAQLEVVGNERRVIDRIRRRVQVQQLDLSRHVGVVAQETHADDLVTRDRRGTPKRARLLDVGAYRRFDAEPLRQVGEERGHRLGPVPLRVDPQVHGHSLPV